MSGTRRTVLVVGSHTDVGKTFVACRLVERLVADGFSVDVRKPVMSGFDPLRPVASDACRLLRAARLGPDIWPDGEDPEDDLVEDLEDFEHLLAACCPWRFPAPLSPDAAARAAGVTLKLDEILAFARRPSEAALVVVEAAGGVMSPLTEDSTGLDLAARLGAPALLVVGTYLGGISHGLTAHLALRSQGVDVAAVVVNRARPGDDEPFRRFLPRTPVLTLPDDANHKDVAVSALARAVAADLVR